MAHGYGWIRDTPDFRDFQYKPPPRLRRAAMLPRSVDLRENMPPIWDQGQYGSCTAHAINAAVAYVQRLSFTPSRSLTYYLERAMEGDPQSDNGAQIRDGIKVVATDGVVNESEWPYDASHMFQAPPSQVLADAQKDLVASYERVKRGVTSLRTPLAEGFPVVVGFSVYESFEQQSVADTGIVPMPSAGERLLGGHAVALVGYDMKTRRFLARNSWGPDWGQSGYFTMPDKYFTTAGLSGDFWVIRS